jgi:sulfite reductase alpha subunit-like flavoprotein
METTIMESVPSSVLLLYGSESGTAVDLANRVCVLGARRGFAMVAEGFDAALGSGGGDPVANLRARADLCGGLVVLMVSTTGDGEVPRNMVHSWRSLLRKSITSDALSGVRFALYGLGDRGYGDKFCAAARKLDARLQQLGANQLNPRVLADDQVIFDVVLGK